MADNEIGLAVQWAERGVDIPARVAGGLGTLTTASDRAATSLDQKLGRAMEGLERREPTMVLRRSVFALESLAASSLGAEGAIGRLGGAMLLLGAGTGTGLALIGGLTAIGFAYKAITERAREAAAETKNLHEAVKRLAAETPEAKQAQIWKDLAQSQRELSQAQADLAKRAQTDVGLQNLGFGPTSSRRQDNIAEMDKLRMKILELQAAIAKLQQPGMIAPVEVEASQSAALVRAASMRPGNLLMRPTFGVPGSVQAAFEQRGFAMVGGVRLRAGGEIEQAAAGERGDRRLEERQARLLPGEDPGPAAEARKRLELGISGAAALMAGAARGGVAGGIGAIGGTVSAFAALKDAPAALGPIGVGLSALSTVGGLFASKQKVVITAFEDQARQQIEQLRADPLTTGYVILGPVDIRSLQQQLGRQARREAQPRFP